MVHDVLKELTDEGGEYRPQDGPEIGSLILIDRGECYITNFVKSVGSHIHMVQYKLNSCNVVVVHTSLPCVCIICWSCCN